MDEINQGSIFYGSQNAGQILQNFQEVIDDVITNINLAPDPISQCVFEHKKSSANVNFNNLSYMYYRTNKQLANSFDEPFILEIYFRKISETVRDNRGFDLTATLTINSSNNEEIDELWLLNNGNQLLTTQELVALCLNELKGKA